MCWLLNFSCAISIDAETCLSPVANILAKHRQAHRERQGKVCLAPKLNVNVWLLKRRGLGREKLSKQISIVQSVSPRLDAM